nr:hypothetical protein Iba_chr07cCG7170 [Ipomoea batatas]
MWRAGILLTTTNLILKRVEQCHGRSHEVCTGESCSSPIPPLEIKEWCHVGGCAAGLPLPNVVWNMANIAVFPFPGVSTASNKATFGATLFTPSCAFSIAKNGVLPDVRIPCWRESLACKEALS